MLKLEKRLPLINTVLLILIIIINLYLIVTPFLPSLSQNIKAADSKNVKKFSQKIHQTPTISQQPNTLTIPSILLDQKIYEGKNAYRTLDQGIWRWPSGSSPDQGSNTILIGHRFTYTNPRGPFYFLNKVKTNDEIGLRWNDKQYVYKVTKTEVVSPKQKQILEPSKEPSLTLYTCTPLWWPKERLVVHASLESIL